MIINKENNLIRIENNYKKIIRKIIKREYKKKSKKKKR